MVKEIMRSQTLLFAVAVAVAVVGVGGAAATLGEKCSTAFEKVGTCVSYATGKAVEPTKDCCGSVTEIRTTEPVCLCYIIQQTHNGSAQIKSMGIEEAKLLQLPTACKLTNASVSDCPKLLNIAPGSPDYDIFNSSSSSTTITTPSVVPGTSSPTTTARGSKHGPQLIAGLGAIAVGVFLCSFPPEVFSAFHT